MNSGCEQLLSEQIHNGPRLVLAEPAADRLLARALNELAVTASAAPRSIPIPARDGQPPTILHLLPIRRAAADLFAATEAISVFTPLTAKHVPGLPVLEGLFDLTSAEARVARGIAGGSTVADLSTTFGTSAATIHSQLKAVMAKTGTGRQAELVQLLAGGALPIS